MTDSDGIKHFVLDTNVLLHDPRSIFSFGDNNVIPPHLFHGKVGKATMRELKTAQFSTTVRGAPLTGEYVTISYLTKFASAPLATETLIVSKEADGVWRIAGYNIAKAPDQ